MEFPRVDPDDRSILFVELDDAECVLTANYDVVVEFIPREFRAMEQSKEGILDNAIWRVIRS